MRRVLLGTGITALLTTVVLLATATFSQSNALAVQWIYAQCNQGTLSSAQYDPAGEGAVVFGSAALCVLGILDSEFGVVVYEAGAKTVNVLSYRMRKVPSTVNNRSFGIFVGKKKGTFGLCLVNSPSKKIACAKLVFKNSAYVELTTIQPTDALVNAKINSKEVAVDPRCGYCF
jgi:hypothetical protein